MPCLFNIQDEYMPDLCVSQTKQGTTKQGKPPGLPCLIISSIFSFPASPAPSSPK
jgi:hypothetical protein